MTVITFVHFPKKNNKNKKVISNFKHYLPIAKITCTFCDGEDVFAYLIVVTFHFLPVFDLRIKKLIYLPSLPTSLRRVCARERENQNRNT